MSIIAQETRVSAVVWDRLKDESRRAELSHWRGAGKWKDDEKWLKVGVNSRLRLERLATNLGRDLWSEPRTMLEWGPGGGANLFAFRDVASIYYGVDISERNLDEAERVVEREGYRGFRPVLIVKTPSEALAAVKQPIDIVLSTAVFQHFPSRAYGTHVLDVLSKLCAPSAIGLIQIRYDESEFGGDEGELEDYERNFIKATSYVIDDFKTACERVGFAVFDIAHINPSSRYVTFYLTKN